MTKIILTFSIILGSLTSISAQSLDMRDNNEQPIEDQKSVGMQSDSLNPESVTQDEINMFADIFREVRDLNQEAQRDMIAAVKNSGLEIETFNEMRKDQRMGELKTTADADMMNRYTEAVKRVERIETDMITEMENTIRDEGLSLERYREIALMVQDSEELQKRLELAMDG